MFGLFGAERDCSKDKSDKCSTCVETWDCDSCVMKGYCDKSKTGYKGRGRGRVVGGRAFSPGVVGMEIFKGYRGVDPNVLVTTIGQTIGDIAGRYRHPATQYIAPPSACSMFEHADDAGICRPNYAMLFVVVAATVAFASVSLGPRR